MVERPLGNSYGAANSYASEKVLRDETIYGIGADTQNTGDITYRIGSALLDTFRRTVLNF